jgi:plastocyanin
MFTSMVRPVRRPVFWMVGMCLLILVSSLAACGGDTGSSSSTTSTSNGANTTSSGSNVNDVSTASSVGTASTDSTASSMGTASSAGTATDATVTTNGKMTIVIKESKSSDGKDTYVFDPATITVKKGEVVTVQNSSNKLQNIDQGDAVKAGVETNVALNKLSTMTFNKVGTFTLKSAEGAVLDVTVTAQ